MGFKVRIAQLAQTVEAETGETILQAALRAGVDYPHGCRSGNCGACKSELLEGETEMSPWSEFALSADERAQGLILACRALPWSDCAVAPLDAEDRAAFPLRHVDCRVSGIAQATHDTRILRLEVVRGGAFNFAAGQYASLTFDGYPPRDFSMANQPEDSVLEFHVRAMPDGLVSPFVQYALKTGDPVKLIGPFGCSHLRERHTGPIIAAAGGSGLAPVKAIVERALACGMRQEIRMYFGVRDERDIYLEDYFRSLAAAHPNFHFEIVLSAPTVHSGRRTGFLYDIIRADFRDLDGCKAYLAGPPIMVETTVAALNQLGVRRADCHADAFYTEAEKMRLKA
ncbi:MAG: 2Fe-2S iron-sulfur cluster-binding protein [Candidatus Binataceae bacterium]